MVIMSCSMYKGCPISKEVIIARSTLYKVFIGLMKVWAEIKSFDVF